MLSVVTTMVRNEIPASEVALDSTKTASVTTDLTATSRQGGLLANFLVKIQKTSCHG
jgi:hypothetical protein